MSASLPVSERFSRKTHSLNSTTTLSLITLFPPPNVPRSAQLSPTPSARGRPRGRPRESRGTTSGRGQATTTAARNPAPISATPRHLLFRGVASQDSPTIAIARRQSWSLATTEPENDMERTSHQPHHFVMFAAESLEAHTMTEATQEALVKGSDVRSVAYHALLDERKAETRPWNIASTATLASTQRACLVPNLKISSTFWAATTDPDAMRTKMSSTGAVGIAQLLPQASVPAVGPFVHLRSHPLRRLDLRPHQAAANRCTSETLFSAEDAFMNPTPPRHRKANRGAPSGPRPSCRGLAVATELLHRIEY